MVYSPFYMLFIDKTLLRDNRCAVCFGWSHACNQFAHVFCIDTTVGFYDVPVAVLEVCVCHGAGKKLLVAGIDVGDSICPHGYCRDSKAL